MKQKTCLGCHPVNRINRSHAVPDMPFHFKNPNAVPNGGYQYVQQESGVSFKENYWVNLVGKVRQHRLANNYPIGANFVQELIDYNCAQNPQWCVDTAGPSLADKAASFARAMVKWIKNGIPVVTPEQYQERLATCRNCPEFSGEHERTFSARCGRCGCATVKLTLSTEACPLGKWNAIVI